MNRRKFMEMGIYIISGSITAVSGIVLARFAIGRAFDKKRAQWIEVKSRHKPVAGGNFQRVILSYEIRDGWTTRNEKTLVYLKTSNEGDVIVISAGCTHLGCIVTWDEQERIFKCPCHDGRYDGAGNVLSGPPSAPLRRHPAKLDGERIIISTDTVPFGGDPDEAV